MHFSWCGAEATTYLLSDRDSHNNVDLACDDHAGEYAHIYRRSVPVHRDVVDLRDPVIDLAEALPLETEAAAALVPREGERSTRT